MNNFEDINKVKYLFLNNVEEVNQNSLLITTYVGFVEDYEEDTIVGKARPIQVNEYCPQYQIEFKNYVAYQVINESFYFRNDYDQYSGTIFRIYSKSAYMDFVLKETIANYIFPDQMQHYSVFCQNHLIHIISFNEPVISKIIK